MLRSVGSLRTPIIPLVLTTYWVEGARRLLDKLVVGSTLLRA